MNEKNFIGSLKNKRLKKYEKGLVILFTILLLIGGIIFITVNIYTFPITVKVDKQDFFATEKYRVLKKHCTVGDTLKAGDPILTISSEDLAEKATKLTGIKQSLNRISFLKKDLFDENSKLERISKAYQNLASNHEVLQRFVISKNDSLERIYDSIINTEEELLTNQEKLYLRDFASEASYHQEEVSILQIKKEMLQSLRDNIIQRDEIDANILETQIGYLGELIEYNRRKANITLDSLSLSTSKKSIYNILSDKFDAFKVENGTITITAPKKVIVSYLPENNHVFKNNILLSYFDKRKFYGEAEVEPYLAAILQSNSQIYLSVNTESSTIGRRMIRGSINKISITPDKDNKYTLQISLPTEGYSSFLVHGLSGTAFHYGN